MVAAMLELNKVEVLSLDAVAAVRLSPAPHFSCGAFTNPAFTIQVYMSPTIKNMTLRVQSLKRLFPPTFCSSSQLHQNAGTIGTLSLISRTH